MVVPGAALFIMGIIYYFGTQDTPGGNAGAVCAGFFFRGDLTYQNALLIIGVTVTIASFFTLLVRFSTEEEKEVGDEMSKILPTSEKESTLVSAT